MVFLLSLLPSFILSQSTLPPSFQHFPRALRQRAPNQEVAALRRIGVAAALGIDLAPTPPLVAEGDFHAQPFADASFDFEFSNVFDHALYSDRFAAEIQRTLHPGGVAVLHVAVHRRGDKYSANDILGLDGVVALFNHSHLLRISKIDAFGLDTELILRKNHHLRQHLFQIFSEFVSNPSNNSAEAAQHALRVPEDTMPSFWWCQKRYSIVVNTSSTMARTL